MGEVVAGIATGGAQPRYVAIRDAVNLAARMLALAPAGETIVSEPLYRTVSDEVEAEVLGQRMVKGFAEPVTYGARQVNESGS
jgi:class 3 adenylate cyclase